MAAPLPNEVARIAIKHAPKGRRRTDSVRSKSFDRDWGMLVWNYRPLRCQPAKPLKPSSPVTQTSSNASSKLSITATRASTTFNARSTAPVPHSPRHPPSAWLLYSSTLFLAFGALVLIGRSFMGINCFEGPT